LGSVRYRGKWKGLPKLVVGGKASTHAGEGREKRLRFPGMDEGDAKDMKYAERKRLTV